MNAVIFQDKLKLTITDMKAGRVTGLWALRRPFFQLEHEPRGIQSGQHPFVSTTACFRLDLGTFPYLKGQLTLNRVLFRFLNGCTMILKC